MSSHRTERINSVIQQEISEALRRDVKDPRLDSSVIITSVETAPDMRHAKVFVSSFSTAEKREILEALASASGFLRRELGEKLRLRHIPELAFEWDNSIERGSHILELLDKVSGETQETGNEEQSK
jgi:ribosome-binding factor A